MTAVGRIEAIGPLIGVRVGNIPQWQQMLADSDDLGPGLPAPVDGLALVDTGATRTMVRPDVAEGLRACKGPGVRVHGLHPDRTWSTEKPVYVETARLVVEIPGSDLAAAVEAIKVPFAQAIGRDDVLAVLGRDLLELVDMTWLGPDRRFEIRARPG